MAEGQTPLKRVVARLRDGRSLKGYIQVSSLTRAKPIHLDDPEVEPVPEKFDLRPDDCSPPIIIHRSSLKALFFVKSFEGNKDYNEVKFFEKNPAIKGLWVRVRFYDGEILEGIVANSIKFIVEPAFYLKPPDPQSNNEMLCVIKEALTDFGVLGVRMAY